MVPSFQRSEHLILHLKKYLLLIQEITQQPLQCKNADGSNNKFNHFRMGKPTHYAIGDC